MWVSSESGKLVLSVQNSNNFPSEDSFYVSFDWMRQDVELHPSGGIWRREFRRKQSELFFWRVKKSPMASCIEVTLHGT
jgi:hypothetical protein